MLVLSRLLTQSVPLPAAMELFPSVLSDSVPVRRNEAGNAAFCRRRPEHSDYQYIGG